MFHNACSKIDFINHRMDCRRFWIHFVALFISAVTFSKGDDPRPTFPNVFEVEVQGIFLEQLHEVDGAVYYDKPNNRAALTYTYQGDTTTSIYDFNDGQLIYIGGNDCTVSNISDNVGGSFFPFSVDKNNKKILANPEEIFYFSKSVLDRQELTTLPTYIYTAQIDFPQYKRTNCTVSHVFSKPEIEVPDCDNHACRSTLMAISIKCLNDKKETEVDHAYHFFRFRSGIRDVSIFLPPVGIYCNIVNKVKIPALPDYFSFSYRIQKDMEGSESEIGVYSFQKKVWYDSKLRLIRIDEFDLDGLLESTRIFDIYGGVSYTTVASISKCVSQPIKGDVVFHEVTELPKIFFLKKPSIEDAVYVGKRNVAGMLYYVWSLTFTEKQTDARIVQEFYFTKVILNDEGGSQLKLSHADIYIYEKKKESQEFQRSAVTHLSISNFRSKPKEWEAFDIAPCFATNQKKGFRLKVSGPDIVRETYTYEDLLERLYIKLIIASNVSVVRISELQGKFDGLQITEFTGWILEKPSSSGSETGQSEPDMNSAYKMIEEAASDNRLSIKIKKLGQEINYVVTAIEEVKDPISVKRDCFSGGSIAAAGLVLFFLGISLGIVSYYVFLKKKKTVSEDKVQMTSVLE